MKNYKAEVTKILDGIGGIHEANEVRTNIICSLIREIVQEAAKNRMDTNTFISGPEEGDDIFQATKYREGYNEARSEILSNVEEILK